MTPTTEKPTLEMILHMKALKYAKEKLQEDIKELGMPIKVIMKDGRIEFIICKCENFRDFGRYEYQETIIGERMRKVKVKKVGIACNKKGCGAVINQDELNKQLYDQKVTQKTQEELQNFPEDETKASVSESR